MFTRMVGIVALLWGGGIVVVWVFRGDHLPWGGYDAGTLTGVAFGFALFIAGVFLAIRGGPKTRSPNKSTQIKDPTAVD